MIKLSGMVDLRPLKEEELGEEHWIQNMHMKKGSLHKQLGVPEDEPIPTSVERDAAEKGGKLGKRARLALTLKGLKHECYDTMTPTQKQKIDEMIEECGNDGSGMPAGGSGQPEEAAGMDDPVGAGGGGIYEDDVKKEEIEATPDEDGDSAKPFPPVEDLGEHKYDHLKPIVGGDSND